MLAKRIIPCLDVDAGRVVKGVRFEELRDAGDPVELAARYDAEGADELVFLDITATVEDRAATYDVIARIADVDEVRALDDAAGVDVQAGDHALEVHPFSVVSVRCAPGS